MTYRRRLERPAGRQALRFSPTVWAKLLFWRDCGPTEIGAFGISDPEDLLLIQDVKLIPQTCSRTTVQLEDGAIAEYFDRQVERGLRPERFGRIWIHTHPGDSALPSTVDEDAFARAFARVDWCVMCILARGGNCYARLEFHTGPGGALRLPIQLDDEPRRLKCHYRAWEHEYRRCVQVGPSDIDVNHDS